MIHFLGIFVRVALLCSLIKIAENYIISDNVLCTNTTRCEFLKILQKWIQKNARLFETKNNHMNIVKSPCKLSALINWNDLLISKPVPKSTGRILQRLLSLTEIKSRLEHTMVSYGPHIWLNNCEYCGWAFFPGIPWKKNHNHKTPQLMIFIFFMLWKILNFIEVYKCNGLKKRAYWNPA